MIERCLPQAAADLPVPRSLTCPVNETLLQQLLGVSSGANGSAAAGATALPGLPGCANEVPLPWPDFNGSLLFDSLLAFAQVGAFAQALGTPTLHAAASTSHRWGCPVHAGRAARVPPDQHRQLGKRSFMPKGDAASSTRRSCPRAFSPHDACARLQPTCYEDLTLQSGCCSLRCRAAVEQVAKRQGGIKAAAGHSTPPPNERGAVSWVRTKVPESCFASFLLSLCRRIPGLTKFFVSPGPAHLTRRAAPQAAVPTFCAPPRASPAV